MLYFYLFNIFIVYHKAGFTFFSKRHAFLLKEGANMSVCHLTALKAIKKKFDFGRKQTLFAVVRGILKYEKRLGEPLDK